MRRGKHTRLVCRTVDRRGRSETPVSRIEREDSRRDIEARREVTQPSSVAVVLAIFRECIN